MGKFKQRPIVGQKGWSVDSSNFGREMLEKMGWKKGKGLGLQESGITDPLQPKKSSFTQGLGFTKDNNKFQVVEDCSEILAKLNADMGLAPKADSWTEDEEEPPPITIRGKVISREEYQSIFGITKKVKKLKEPAVITPESEIKRESSDKSFVSSVNSVDYFKSKFAEKMAKLGGDGNKQKTHPVKVEKEEESQELLDQSVMVGEEEEPSQPSAEEEALLPEEPTETLNKSILTKTPKKFIYVGGALESSSGKKIRFNKHVSLLHLDLCEGTIQELVYPHLKSSTVMTRFREFNKENSLPAEEETCTPPRPKKRRAKKKQKVAEDPSADELAGSPQLPTENQQSQDSSDDLTELPRTPKKKKKSLKRKLEETDDPPTLNKSKKRKVEHS